MSDAFQSLIVEAERLAVRFNADAVVEGDDTFEAGPFDSWHDRLAARLPIAATGELKGARLVGENLSLRVEFLHRSPPEPLAALALQRARGENRTPERVAEAIRLARTLIVRALASQALMVVSYIEYIRNRGHAKSADHLASLGPIGLRTDDWSDADSVCVAPWRYTGWNFTVLQCLASWTESRLELLDGFSLMELYDAVALSFICDAASADSPDDAMALLVEAAWANGSSYFHAAWESALDFALHETPEEIVRQVRSRAARNAANASHRENRAMRDTVYQWCDGNLSRYRSMDAAAEAIAGKLVPTTFRTVRAWIGDWRKKQSARSA